MAEIEVIFVNLIQINIMTNKSNVAELNIDMLKLNVRRCLQ